MFEASIKIKHGVYREQFPSMKEMRSKLQEEYIKIYYVGRNDYFYLIPTKEIELITVQEIMEEV